MRKMHGTLGQAPRRAVALAAAAPTPTVTPGSTPSTDVFSTALEKLAPIATELYNSSAAEDVEVLKAKIRNNEALRDKFPEPLKTFYRNEVRKLKAKLVAKTAAAADERATAASKTEWSNLGKAAAVVGILIGVAVLGGVLKRSRA